MEQGSVVVREEEGSACVVAWLQGSRRGWSEDEKGRERWRG